MQLKQMHLQQLRQEQRYYQDDEADDDFHMDYLNNT